MNDDVTKKACRTCCREIDGRAGLCPHCRTWQSRWEVLLRPGWMILWPPLFLLPSGLLKFTVFTRVMGEFGMGADFAPHAHRVRVLHSDMIVGSSGDRPRIAVVGEIRNESELAWAEPQIEVQFRDGNGKLVDTATCFSRSAVALPGRDMGFKATVTPELPLERYASWEVFVRSAGEPKHDW